MVLPVTSFLADIDLSTVVYPAITMLMSRHQHFFAPQKNLNCHFLLPASIFLTKYFHLRIHVHQCSISMVVSLVLGTAQMLLCNNGIATPSLQHMGWLNISAELLKMCTNAK